VGKERDYIIYFNPLEAELVQIIFKNSVRTSKITLHLNITKINWLMLFQEMITIYSENHLKLVNTRYSVKTF
jgi:hypothetical protein